eukprot:scaffold19_cov286-Prasinococcus_capsulatus_cf.AAC.2
MCQCGGSGRVGAGASQQSGSDLGARVLRQRARVQAGQVRRRRLPRGRLRVGLRAAARQAARAAHTLRRHAPPASMGRRTDGRGRATGRPRIMGRTCSRTKFE